MKVALVTGAARGIGAATAAEFANAGYSLALLDIDGDELQRTANKLESTGTEVLPLAVDLSSLE